MYLHVLGHLNSVISLDFSDREMQHTYVAELHSLVGQGVAVSNRHIRICVYTCMKGYYARLCNNIWLAHGQDRKCDVCMAMCTRECLEKLGLLNEVTCAQHR